MGASCLQEVNEGDVFCFMEDVSDAIDHSGPWLALSIIDSGYEGKKFHLVDNLGKVETLDIPYVELQRIFITFPTIFKEVNLDEVGLGKELYLQPFDICQNKRYVVSIENIVTNSVTGTKNKTIYKTLEYIPSTYESISTMAERINDPSNKKVFIRDSFALDKDKYSHLYGISIGDKADSVAEDISNSVVRTNTIVEKIISLIRRISMPSKSEKQKKFFAWLAHDEKAAKEIGVDPEVAKDFHREDVKKDKEKEDKKSDSK